MTQHKLLKQGYKILRRDRNGQLVSPLIGARRYRQVYNESGWTEATDIVTDHGVWKRQIFTVDTPRELCLHFAVEAEYETDGWRQRCRRIRLVRRIPIPPELVKRRGRSSLRFRCGFYSTDKNGNEIVELDQWA